MDKKHIISEIIRTARENGGKPLGRAKFQKETGIKPSDWFGKFWTKWGDALVEAGFEPNKLQTGYEDDYLFGKLIDLIQELDHFPNYAEIRMKSYSDPDSPSHNTFFRLGRKRELSHKLLEYAESHKVSQRIIDICRKEYAHQEELPTEAPQRYDEDVEFSYVYLIKSGKYFKIGRSKSAERREFELKIHLPEKPKLIHKIKTDDPVGIERYWHNRFNKKRKGGEWFDLSPADIKAFRRRKFM